MSNVATKFQAKSATYCAKITKRIKNKGLKQQKATSLQNYLTKLNTSLW